MERRIDLDSAAVVLREELERRPDLGAVSLTWKGFEAAFDEPFKTERGEVIDPYSVGIQLRRGHEEGRLVLYVGGWADMEYWSGAPADEAVDQAPGWEDWLDLGQFRALVHDFLQFFNHGGGPAWTSSDAWILASTSDGRRGGSLADLIGTADAINHSLPTREELASGLGALIAAGLVEHVNDRYRTTSAGKRIKRHWRGGMFNWSKTMLPRLRELPRGTSERGLSDDEVQAAYEAYRRSWRSSP